MTKTIKNHLYAGCLALLTVTMLMLVAFQNHPQQLVPRKMVNVEKQRTPADPGSYVFFIRKSADADVLENMRKHIQQKGFDISYSNMEFEKGKLVLLEGTIRYKDFESRFRGKNFNVLVIRYQKNKSGYVFKTETDPVRLSN